jgi:hypothetical protein
MEEEIGGGLILLLTNADEILSHSPANLSNSYRPGSYGESNT